MTVATWISYRGYPINGRDFKGDHFWNLHLFYISEWDFAAGSRAIYQVDVIVTGFSGYTPEYILVSRNLGSIQ